MQPVKAIEEMRKSKTALGINTTTANIMESRNNPNERVITQKREIDQKLSIVRRNAEKLREKRKETAYQENSLGRKPKQINQAVKSKVQSFNTNYRHPKFLPKKSQNSSQGVTSNSMKSKKNQGFNSNTTSLNLNGKKQKSSASQSHSNFNMAAKSFK